MITFEDFKELVLFDSKLGEELLNTFGEGDWQDNQIFLHKNLSMLAEYELTEGWYAHSGLSQKDWNGAPNPLDFINLKQLGEALSNTWDNSCYALTEDGRVLTTSTGW